MSTATHNGTVPADVRGAAAYHLARGHLPIPVHYRTKKPVGEEWEKQRPTPEDLDRLFPEGGRLNLGLLLGEPSGGLVDVDLDEPEACAAAPYLLASTAMQHGRPGKPRSHWWYATDKPPDKASAKFKDVDGCCLLELRSTGGQTVIPPSVHADTGEPLQWHCCGEPAFLRLDDLRPAVCAVAAAALVARHWPAKGCRHDLILALCGGLLRAGWAVERVEAFLRAVFAATKTPDGEKHLHAVADTKAKLDAGANATGWNRVAKLLVRGGAEVVRRLRGWLGLTDAPKPATRRRRVRTLRPFTSFPVEALPEPVRGFVVQAAAALGCDPSYVALIALAVVASAIGNTRTICLKRGWEEPSILWTAIVGDSGTLKSPAWLLAVGYLLRLQNRLREQYLAALQEHEAAAKRTKNGGGAIPEPPCQQRLIVSDTTIEKLSEVLEDNPRGILATRDELSGWLSSFTRYKGKAGGSDLPLWLEAHRAGCWLIDRKTGDRRSLFVPRAAVCVTGGIQPGVLARALTHEHFEAGLAARLLLTMPPKVPKRWTETEVAPEAEEAYHRLLDRLLALKFATDKDSRPVPQRLRLSPDGKAAWVAYYNAWAREQAAVEGDLAAAFSKLEGYTARLALLHHVVTHVGLEVDDAGHEVGARSVAAAITLSRWFAQEAARIYSTLTESEEERQARQLVEFIRSREDSITVRGLMRANCRLYPDAAAAEAALQALVDAGLVQWVAFPPKKKGKPIRGVKLCMTHDTHDTDADAEEGDDPGAGDTDDDTDPGSGPTSPPPSGADSAASADSGERCGEESPPGSDNRVMRVMCHAQEGDADPSTDGSEGPSPKSGTVSAYGVMRGAGGGEFVLVREAGQLQAVAQALDESVLVGLDTETTGLNPRSDRVRLLSLATDRGTYLVDASAVDPRPLWDLLAQKTLVAHNASFDLAFLAPRGFVPGAVRDTLLLSQLLHAGHRGVRHSLAACAGRELGCALDKDLQASDWSGTLSAPQLAYAAADTAVLPPLEAALRAKIDSAGLAAAAALECRAVPAVVWLASGGVAFDPAGWSALAREAEAEVADLRRQLDALAPPRPGENALMGGGWNWDSPTQVKEALAAVGVLVEATDDRTLATLHHPLGTRLRKYRAAAKRLSTYGLDWLQHVAADGRIYAGWRQLGADSGRMACRKPNLQNQPRDKRYRRCYVAPPGRVLVKADYSAVEMRIAAKISGDQNLLDLFQSGLDPHTRTAQLLLGKEDVSADDRQLAKSANFGLLYGMGWRGYQAYARAEFGLSITDRQAQDLRAAFFRAYPGLVDWHREVQRGHAGETRTLCGRRRLLDARTPDTWRLNTPVQGTGADGLKQALALLWERRAECPEAFPVLAVHDEIVVECPAGRAAEAAAWLRRSMLGGFGDWLDPVPVAVEVKTAPTWGG
jgi:DNA polymerase I-like protein with 3'-5' exonuclease and polymerase domains